MSSIRHSALILASLITASSVSGIWMVSNQKKPRFSNNDSASSSLTSPSSSDSSKLSEEEAEDLTSINNIVLPPSLLKFTEDLVGLSFPKSPKALLGDHELILDAASQKWTEIDFNYFVKIHYALEAIGIVPNQLNLGHQLITAETLGARGSYDHRAQQIVLSEDFDFESIPDQAEAIKLLTIALVDQNSQLQAPKNLQAFLVKHSITMGAASASTERFYALSSRQYETAIRHKLSKEEQELFDSFSLLAKQLTLYPIRTGHSYLKSLRIDSKDKLFPKGIPTPMSTYSLEGRNRIEYFFQDPTGNLEFKDHLGPAITAVSLGKSKSMEENKQLISYLDDDQITISTQPEEKTIQVIWQTKWRNNQAAEEFSNRFKEERLAQRTTVLIEQFGPIVKISATQSDEALKVE